MLQILYYNSDVGKKKINQDNYIVKVINNGVLCAVADGMGGGFKGEVLSEIAINILDKKFKVEPKFPLLWLQEVVFKINKKLKSYLKGLKGGTTLSAFYYKSGKIYFINIGDSKIFICRDNKIIDITIEQNLYMKNILKEEIANVEDKKLVSFILGITSDFEIEELFKDSKWQAIGVKELQKNDFIIISTDGFYEYINRDCFCKDLLNKDFNKMFLEVKNSSHDNITAIIGKEI